MHELACVQSKLYMPWKSRSVKNPSYKTKYHSLGNWGVPEYREVLEVVQKLALIESNRIDENMSSLQNITDNNVLLLGKRMKLKVVLTEDPAIQ